MKYTGPRHELMIKSMAENPKVNFFVCSNCKLVVKNDKDIITGYRNVCMTCSPDTHKECPECKSLIMIISESNIMITCPKCKNNICLICSDVVRKSKTMIHTDGHLRNISKNIRELDYKSCCILIKNHILLSDVPGEYRTRELIMLAIKHNREGSCDMLEECPDYADEMYEEICLQVVRNKKEGLGRIRYPDRLGDYYRICMCAIENDVNNIKYVNCKFVFEKTNKYYELCLNAVSQSGLILEYVNRQYIRNAENYFDICLEAIKKNAIALKYVVPTTEFMYLSESNYVELCEKSVENMGITIKYVDRRHLKNDNYRKICIKAIENTYNALKYIQIKDSLIYETALKKDALALKYIDIQTPEMCLHAVRMNGLSLKFSIHKNEEICIAAIENDPNALEFCVNQSDEMCKMAVRREGSTLRFVKNKKDCICYDAVRNNPNALEYVPIFYKLKCYMIVRNTKGKK